MERFHAFLERAHLFPMLSLVGLGLWGLSLWMGREMPDAPPRRRWVLGGLGAALLLVGEGLPAAWAAGPASDLWGFLRPVLRLLSYLALTMGLIGLVQRGRDRDEEAAFRRLSRSYWIALTAVFILALQLGSPARWAVTLALLPGAVIGAHGLYLHLHKGRTLQPDTARIQGVLRAWAAGSREGEDPPRLSSAYEMYFSPGVLALRYGVPAILVTVTALAMAGVLVLGWWPGWEALPPGEAHPFRLAALVGLGGAVTYTVVQLGQRAAAADLTASAAYACMATLLSGPMLAGIAYLLLKGDRPGDPVIDFKTAAACFMVGYAPRPFTQFLWESVRRQLAGSEASPRLVNNLELMAIRGVTADVAERLREEGIQDAFALAYAEPYRLFRNTGFSHQRILAWIDEALLYQYLPTQAEKLIRECGVTGAVDLAWHYVRHLDAYTGTPGPDAPADWLAECLGWRDRARVADLLERIHRDSQARTVAALYTLGCDAPGGRCGEERKEETAVGPNPD